MKKLIFTFSAITILGVGMSSCKKEKFLQNILHSNRASFSEDGLYRIPIIDITASLKELMQNAEDLDEEKLNLIDQKSGSINPVAQVVPIPQSEMDYLFTIHENTYGPVFSTDNLIGLFLRANLNDVFYVSTYFGAGFLFWKSLDDNILLLGGKKPNQGIDLSSQFSLGLGYKFGKK